MHTVAMKRWQIGSLLCCLLLLAACTPPPPPRTAEELKPLHEKLTANLGPDDALLIGAGDIAECHHGNSPSQSTAALVQAFPEAKVFTAGDNAYKHGSRRNFESCYDKFWGAFKERTRPSPGNHDYGIYFPHRRHNADPYFAYFGDNATNPDTEGDGFYSFDLGGWHIVSLNSMAGQTGAPTMAKQRSWLETDLAATQKSCILAYWHHPLYSSGPHGHDDKDPGRQMGPLWDVLLLHHADVIVNGHDHHYERFAPQKTAHAADAQGIREFIVGNGGGETRRIGALQPNSEKQLDGTGDFGVLLLTLHPNSYEWHFLKADGTEGDSSTGPEDCH